VLSSIGLGSWATSPASASKERKKEKATAWCHITHLVQVLLFQGKKLTNKTSASNRSQCAFSLNPRPTPGRDPKSCPGETCDQASGHPARHPNEERFLPSNLKSMPPAFRTPRAAASPNPANNQKRLPQRTRAQNNKLSLESGAATTAPCGTRAAAGTAAGLEARSKGRVRWKEGGFTEPPGLGGTL